MLLNSVRQNKKQLGKLFSKIGQREISTFTQQPVVLSLTTPSDKELTKKMFKGLSTHGKKGEKHKVGVADFLSRSDIKEAQKGNLSSKHSASQLEALLKLAEEMSIDVDLLPIFAANNYNEELFEKSLVEAESHGIKKAVFTGGSFSFDGMGMDTLEMMKKAWERGIEPVSTISPLGRSVSEMKEYAESRGVISFVSELVMDPQQILNMVEALQGYDLTIAHPMPSNGNFFRRENGKARKVKYNEDAKRFEQQDDFVPNVAFEKDGSLSSESRLSPNLVEMPSSLFDESGHVSLSAFENQIQDNLEMLKEEKNLDHWIRGYNRTQIDDEFDLITQKQVIE